MQIKSEPILVKRIEEELNKDKPHQMRKCFKNKNLATMGFDDIYYSWHYDAQTPPKLQVDLIFAFIDPNRVIDEAFIIGVEVKYFKGFKNRGFYEGLGQALSYFIFGFDGVALWHIFSKDLEDKKIQNFVNATNYVVEYFNLPIFYFGGKIIDEQKLEIMSFAPVLSVQGNVEYFTRHTHMHLLGISSGKPLRNPFLFSPYPDTIRKRRGTLKVMLKIPT